MFQRRVEVYTDLLKAGKIEAVTVDCAKTNELLKLLDTVVIKLEGGTDEDLALLEKEYEGIQKISLFCKTCFLLWPQSEIYFFWSTN